MVIFTVSLLLRFSTRVFFCGSESNKTYMDYEVDWFDMCESDTWSMLWINDFLSQLGCGMDKYVEWAKNCRVREYGRGVFQVISLNNTYIVELNMNSCNCKRWELSGIPCHHAIACFRHERIEPESMVHSCYTVEEYKKCYGFNMMPMRDPKQWEKMHGIPVYPPIYTKVMGRPKKSRKKDAEEKKDKKGVRKLTKHGVTMHCSVCGAADHNKKGHYKHANQQPTKEASEESEEEDDPSIIANIMPHRVYPQLDPTQTPDSMVYKMQQNEKFTYPTPMDYGPLPESSFIANARDTIPVGRVTTAMTSGRVRSVATAASNVTRGGSAQRGGNVPRRGRGARGSIGGRRGGNVTRGGGVQRGGNVSTATTGGNVASGSNPPRGARAAAPGFYNLIFGADGAVNQEPPLFMQAEEEVIVSQNAPQDALFREGWPADLHDFLSL